MAPIQDTYSDDDYEYESDNDSDCETESESNSEESDSEYNSEEEAEEEVEEEVEEAGNIVGGKRKRAEPKRFQDEEFVKGSGCCKRKGYDWTDMKFDGSKEPNESEFD